MNTNKNTAKIVGILYIIGTAAGIGSNVFLGPILNQQVPLISIAGSRFNIVLGSVLILTMAYCLTMVPVVLYPIFKKFNEAMALGAVVFRGALEGIVYSMQALLYLLLIPLSQGFSGADSASIAVLEHLGNFFMGADIWFAHILSIVFSLGALMIYYVFYHSRLIPRWLSIWGLVGGILYFSSPLLGMFGIEAGFLMLPLALQEMVMALWLIFKGFNREVIEPR